MKVLIVEDNADDRKLLHLILEQKGCGSVIEARDGREGFALAREHRPDLIISDALMPRMDGFQFLRLVKSDADLSDVPFIFYSAVYTGLKDEALAFRLGAAAFIHKPEEPEVLWRKLTAIMENPEAGRRQSSSYEPLEEESEYLREYNLIVAAKLEEKVRDLEESLARRKQAEEELMKFYSAIEQSPVSIVITDAMGYIEFVNPKFTHLTGYLSEEVLGKNPRIMKSGETSPEEYKRLWATITSGEVWHGEFHNKKKNGELFWEKVAISPVRDSAGLITHYIAIKEDITGRKELEEQLRHAQRMEAIGQMAGWVAHDFNNYLQIIINFGFLIDKQFNEYGIPVNFVEKQLAAAHRAVNLTGALLTFSRKQANKPKPIDVNRILTESRKLLERVVGEDIVFEVMPAPYDLIVQADEGGMHQVLINLVTNARDAMPRGGSLTITAEKVPHDDPFKSRHGFSGSAEYAMISVTDTGDGVAPADLEHIFEPFFTTKDQGKGTGLGLAITYGIICQHDGIVEVDSVQGEGTSFRIYLPLLPSLATDCMSQSTSPEPPGIGTILLVEDDLMVRRALHSVMIDCGYTVLEAADGEEAVRVFLANIEIVDLIIMDMILPKKNGWDTLQEIRSCKPGIKNIFLSGYAADILKSKGFEKGEETLIVKPTEPHVLLEEIRRQLGMDCAGATDRN